MLRIHHVNLGIPEDGLDAEKAFLTDVLGLRYLPPTDEAPMANWFEADGGVQVHLSRDPNHRAPERAHVAVELGDELDAVEARLTARGMEFRAVGDDADRRVICRDPAGNMWELRGYRVAVG